jgi:phosphomannomutase
MEGSSSRTRRRHRSSQQLIVSATDIRPLTPSARRGLLAAYSILPILAVLSLASTQKKPLSVVSRSYGLPVAVSDRLENYPVEASTALISHLRNSNDNLAVFLRDIGEVISMNGMDGIRVLLSGKRIIHFRPSGNAPEMRCYAEAETETGALELLNAGLARLRYWAENT